MVKTSEKSAQMHAALTGMFPDYQSFCKIEFQPNQTHMNLLIRVLLKIIVQLCKSRAETKFY